jgi:NADH-quinone oxidoreductase subunit L
VGGWTAGQLHLITHAFFKALLFLAAGAVIHGLHHEQDLRRMGGQWKKMPITATTMLVGVLAIVGTPFFSGWYSKDQIIGQALGFGLSRPRHLALAILPLVGAMLTGFYMFRLWLLAFTDVPRDRDLHDHARESPWIMLVPLIILALFSFGVGWGPEFWTADGSTLGHLLDYSKPDTVGLYFKTATHAAHEHHELAGALALGAALLGVGVAFGVYGFKNLHVDGIKRRLAPVHAFLANKWYFDELYDALLVRPTVLLAFALARVDKRSAAASDAEVADRRIDPTSVDGLASAIGLIIAAIGARLRLIQSGLVRRYVLVLVLTTVFLFAILSILTGRAGPG